MKLIRFGPAGAERPGLLLADGRQVAAPAFVTDYHEAFFAGDGLDRLREWVEGNLHGAVEVPAGARIGPAVARPSKIVCVGLNYRSHAEETGAAIPTEPVLFMKASSAWHGPYDDVEIPPGAEKVDWEVELALVIGKKARQVSESSALDFVAGYSIMLDYSERAWQKERGGQWVKGKSADTFAPFGPWLVTTDELPDHGSLPLNLKVNGQTMQDGSTSDLIFPVPYLVSYISRFMTLLPGDVISTGTPSGVGAGHVPPLFLKPGDVVEASAGSLGNQRQRVVAGRV
ncbi:MAG: FAA hydrolase family protein [Verrucomicrobiaceae bacterium]|nr:MAG: FAA hydrolase family protein [Verrucomicrobiaceae bacterium]